MPPLTLYLASNNPHKAAELQAMARAEGLPVVLRAAPDIGGMPEVAEDTGTFEGNARKKALALRTSAPAGAGVLADDSGLCVDALGGAPGVDSAYYAGRPGDAEANLALLAGRMRGIPAPGRRAHFVCVLHLIEPGGKESDFEGRCHGMLLEKPSGTHGFGYDPLFVPDGRTESFADLGPEVKNTLSARSIAWRSLARYLRLTVASCSGG
jgi:XTP/dITP diphosphohydrolase